MIFDHFLGGLELIFRLDIFFMMSVGLVAGMFVGALPGFTTVMAMAVLLPLSFFMDPLVGIPFLIGVYKGGIYGGSIPAILVSMPGTGASVATTFDGPALTKKKQGRKALEMALFSSFVGDTTSDLITLLLIGPIAIVAMMIGAPELAAVIFLSLLVITVTGNGVFLKGLLMLLLGLFLSLIGQDPIGSMSRFTFDLFSIRSGIPLLPMLIGVFALPELMLAIEKRANEAIRERAGIQDDSRLTLADIRRCMRTILRSTAIGTAVGVMPGAGQVVSAFMGYAAAKNASRHPETFGKGELEGIAAAEAANNATNGPTLVPLLTLGIPGDNITAILLGAFIAQGMRPGPQLFNEQGSLVYAIMLAMILANILFLVIGYLLIPAFARVVTIRRSLLLPMVVVFAFAGSFIYRFNPLDLYVLIAFGVLGYIARKLRFDVTPMVMGFILGPILEYSFGQTVTMSQGNLAGYLLTERPIASALVAATPFVAFLLWRKSRRMMASYAPAGAGAGH